jgi:hypothetical protein
VTRIPAPIEMRVFQLTRTARTKKPRATQGRAGFVTVDREEGAGYGFAGGVDTASAA